jgi:hypothetical protein
MMICDSQGRRAMMKSIAAAGFALAVTTSAQAMSPQLQPDSMVTQIRYGCGPGQTVVNGQCVYRSQIRQYRRDEGRYGGPYQYQQYPGQYQGQYQGQYPGQYGGHW